jgi:hypothetical protein
MDLANMGANGLPRSTVMCQHVAAGAAIAACPGRLRPSDCRRTAPKSGGEGFEHRRGVVGLRRKADDN